MAVAEILIYDSLSRLTERAFGYLVCWPTSFLRRSVVEQGCFKLLNVSLSSVSCLELFDEVDELGHRLL